MPVCYNPGHEGFRPKLITIDRNVLLVFTLPTIAAPGINYYNSGLVLLRTRLLPLTFLAFSDRLSPVIAQLCMVGLPWTEGGGRAIWSIDFYPPYKYGSARAGEKLDGANGRRVEFR